MVHVYHCNIPTDFNNPNDPHDRSFDPHPTDYPVGELEFPNSGATERYVSHLFLLPYVHGVWQCALSPFTWCCSGLFLKHQCRAFCGDQTPPAAIETRVRRHHLVFAVVPQ